MLLVKDLYRTRVLKNEKLAAVFPGRLEFNLEACGELSYGAGAA